MEPSLLEVEKTFQFHVATFIFLHYPKYHILNLWRYILTFNLEGKK